MNEFNDLLQKICNELNIKLTIFPDGWLKILEKNNITHFISGYRFDNNCYAIGEIMNDKGLFYDVLKYKNIPIVEQKIIFKNYYKEDIIDYFNNHNKEIIIKGNTGNAGISVYKIKDINKAFEVIDNLFLKEYSISLSPFYNIKNEYRVIILNNEIKLIFGKIKPFIIGDGKSTLNELMQNNDKYYDLHIKNIQNKKYIPLKDEKIDLDFKFNLSSGGSVFLDIEDGLKEKIEFLAKKVAEELNISFASIDIILTNDNKLLVLEANTGVTLNKFSNQTFNGYNIVYNIYKEAIKLMFS